MNRRQKIIVSVVGIFLVLLILVGLTYAYFLTKIQGNTKSTSITVKTANIALVYGDDDGSIIGDGEVITPNTTFEPKTFSVENNGTGTVSYSVVLDNVSITNVSTGEETSFESNDFVYTLTCESGCNSVSDETTLPLYNNGILVSNSIDGGEKQTYSITITYKDTGVDQSGDMNKSLSARINIIDIRGINPYSDNMNTLAYNIINNAKLNKNGTELKAIPDTEPAKEISWSKGTGEYGTEKVSTNSLEVEYYPWLVADSEAEALSGSSVSSYDEAVGKYVYDQWGEWTKYLEAYDETTSTLTFIAEIEDYEKELATANDDYGTSYYYRGNVEDNYVTFANMCWRIVRIAGDGSIKLILEDQDETCSKTMNGNWDIANTGYGHTSDYDSSVIAVKINYLAGYSGKMADKMLDFQTSKLTDYTSKLKSGDWCYDDTAYQDSAGTTLITDTSSYYVNGTRFTYGTNIRVWNNKPSLKCSGTNMTKFGDATTDMYVGALTADEIVLAGSDGHETINRNYYLINDYQKNNAKDWWSLSPSYYNYPSDVAYVVRKNGKLYSFNNVGDSYDVRPAVSLKTGTLITGGDGTIDDPYVIG